MEAALATSGLAHGGPRRRCALEPRCLNGGGFASPGKPACLGDGGSGCAFSGGVSSDSCPGQEVDVGAPGARAVLLALAAVRLSLGLGRLASLSGTAGGDAWLGFSFFGIYMHGWPPPGRCTQGSHAKKRINSCTENANRKTKVLKNQPRGEVLT